MMFWYCWINDVVIVQCIHCIENVLDINHLSCNINLNWWFIYIYILLEIHIYVAQKLMGTSISVTLLKYIYMIYY